MNPPSIPPREQKNISETSRSVERVFEEFPMPILPNISGAPMGESLIDIHWSFRYVRET